MTAGVERPFYNVECPENTFLRFLPSDTHGPAPVSNGKKNKPEIPEVTHEPFINHAHTSRFPECEPSQQAPQLTENDSSAPGLSALNNANQIVA